MSKKSTSMSRTEFGYKLPKSAKEVEARDAGRNIGEEVVQATRDVKAGRYGAMYTAGTNSVVKARMKTGLSLTQFAAALYISPRTLQLWERGRRQPPGVAQTLLKIVTRYPEYLHEIIAARVS